MKTKKLLAKIRALLSADRRRQIAKYESLSKTLAKLAKKAASLREKLDGETDASRRAEIEHKLKVIKAQRKKGKKLKAELEALREAD